MGIQARLQPVGEGPQRGEDELLVLTTIEDPSPRATDRQPQNEATMYDSERAQLDRNDRVTVRRAIRALTDPRDLVLDLGCGTGVALVEAIRARRMAIGIESSPQLASEALAGIERATVNRAEGFAAV